MDTEEKENVEGIDEEVYGLCEYCHHQGLGPNCYRCEWIASEEELEEGVFCDWYEPYYEEDDDEWCEEIEIKEKIFPDVMGTHLEKPPGWIEEANEIKEEVYENLINGHMIWDINYKKEE